MKEHERHQLKQNEFAATAARVMAAIQANRDRALLVGIAVVVLAAVAGGYFYWRARVNNRASGELAIAMAIRRAPVTPAPTLPTSTQQSGTFPSEAARHEAALQQFQKTAAEYPNTAAGLTARYHVAVELLSLGRHAEAQTAFQEVANAAGASIYATSARLGVAEALALSGKHDEAIARLTDLAADRDGPLPVDAILMQLARVSAKAGKTEDARAAYKRVVDEFPQSLYAGEARQQLAQLN
jgi:TolA-binding protein